MPVSIRDDQGLEIAVPDPDSASEPPQCTDESGEDGIKTLALRESKAFHRSNTWKVNQGQIDDKSSTEFQLTSRIESPAMIPS